MATQETTRPDAALRVQPPKMGYVPALDGMRGISLPGTIYTHFAIFLGFLPTAPHWLLRTAGPFTLNIEMFFTLSGALITSLLVSEHQRKGSVSLKSFYLRRSRRLGPALLFSIVGLLVAQYLMSGPARDLPLGQAPWLSAAVMLVFLGNWRLLGNGDALGWMGPAWTLGIEEQFYLTWPILLIAMLRARWKQAEVLMALALVMIAFVAVSTLSDAHYGRQKTFYMTTTQVPAILIGCALGYVLTASPGCWLARLLRYRLVALAGFAGMVVMSLAWYDQTRTLDRGGYVLYGAAACLLIGHCMVMSAQPSVISRVLGWRPFVVIGQVSYEAYLIHCVVILAVLRAFPTMSVPRMMALDTVLIAVLSAAFYYGIGDPIRRRGWQAGLLRRGAARPPVPALAKP